MSKKHSRPSRRSRSPRAGGHIDYSELLISLWRQYLRLRSLPPLDGWLSRIHGQGPALTPRARSRLAGELFAALRLGYLGAFVLFEEAAPPVTEADLQLRLERFRERCDGLTALLPVWRRSNPQRLVNLVKARVEGGGLPADHRGRYPADTAVLEALQQACRGPAALEPQMVWAGIPLHFRHAIERRAEISAWPEQTLCRFLEACGRPAPLWLRLRDATCTERVVAELQQQAFLVQAHQLALRVQGASSVYELPSFREGLFEVQDFASQQITALVDSRPGQLIWDCCAGSGGKTLGIASRMANRGAVYASDRSLAKLKDLERRARRARLRDIIRVVAWDGTVVPDFGREVAANGGFDRVLVDAPCSASGTWRRNPDARFRLQHGELAELNRLQLMLLSTAATALRPGGRLIYATCSFFVEENEALVRGFLDKGVPFRLLSQKLLGSPEHDSDTMFCAVLERTAG